MNAPGLVEAGVGIAGEWWRGGGWREHVAKEHDELERLTFEKEFGAGCVLVDSL